MTVKEAKSTLLAAMWLFCMAVVFALHWGYLSKGWGIEDELFLGMGYHPTRPGMIAVIGDWSDFLDFFRTDRGWYYRPFTLIYFAMLHAFAGDNPLWFHAASLVLHGSVIAAITLLIYRLTANRMAAFFAAALFLLWPFKEQAVWWISSASTLLSALAALVSVHLWLSFRETERKTLYALSLLAAVMAMGFKTEGIVALFSIAGIEAVHSNFKKSWPLIIPFACISAAFIGLDKISAGATTPPFTTAVWLHKWGAFVEFQNLMVGFAGYMTLLGLVVFSAKNSSAEIRKLSLALMSCGVAYSAVIVVAVGWFFTWNNRFFYTPLLFVACAVALILAHGGKPIARYFLAALLTYACTTPFQASAIYLFPFVAESSILLGTACLALALKKFQNECEAVYPLLVVALFFAVANGRAWEWSAVSLVALALVYGTALHKSSVKSASAAVTTVEVPSPS